jgi:hypothetical protein
MRKQVNGLKRIQAVRPMHPDCDKTPVAGVKRLKNGVSQAVLIESSDIHDTVPVKPA